MKNLTNFGRFAIASLLITTFAAITGTIPLDFSESAKEFAIYFELFIMLLVISVIFRGKKSFFTSVCKWFWIIRYIIIFAIIVSKYLFGNLNDDYTLLEIILYTVCLILDTIALYFLLGSKEHIQNQDKASENI